MDDLDQGISDVLKATGEPPTPTQPASPRVYGVPNGAHEMIERIKAVSRAAIDEHYAQATRAQQMADALLNTAKEFDEQMSGYTDRHIAFLETFLSFCSTATESAAKHLNGYAEKLKTSAFPRADGSEH